MIQTLPTELSSMGFTLKHSTSVPFIKTPLVPVVGNPAKALRLQTSTNQNHNISLLEAKGPATLSAKLGSKTAKIERSSSTSYFGFEMKRRSEHKSSGTSSKMLTKDPHLQTIKDAQKSLKKKRSLVDLTFTRNDKARDSPSGFLDEKRGAVLRTQTKQRLKFASPDHLNTLGDSTSKEQFQSSRIVYPSKQLNQNTLLTLKQSRKKRQPATGLLTKLGIVTALKNSQSPSKQPSLLSGLYSRKQSQAQQSQNQSPQAGRVGQKTSSMVSPDRVGGSLLASDPAVWPLDKSAKHKPLASSSTSPETSSIVDDAAVEAVMDKLSAAAEKLKQVLFGHQGENQRIMAHMEALARENSVLRDRVRQLELGASQLPNIS